MDDRPAESPPTKASSLEDTFTSTGSGPRSRTDVPWFRAALTVVVLIAALSVLLAHEAPTLLPTARDRLFPPPAPSATTTPPPSTADVLRSRPLHVPLLASGTPCPIVAGRKVAPGLGEVRGNGPMYVDLGSEGVLRYGAAEDFSSPEWGGQTTIWALPPKFTGSVLVRGRQLDGPNEVRFGRGSTPVTELLFRQAPSDPPNDWIYEVDYTRVRAPGCYAFQIDSETFSDIVVFQAKPEVGVTPQ